MEGYYQVSRKIDFIQEKPFTKGEFFLLAIDIFDIRVQSQVLKSKPQIDKFIQYYQLCLMQHSLRTQKSILRDTVPNA